MFDRRGVGYNRMKFNTIVAKNTQSNSHGE